MKNLNISSQSPTWGDDSGAGDASQTLLPGDLQGQRFLKWFHHPWGFIHSITPDWGQRPAWQFEHGYYLEARNLWREYCNQTCLLGLGFGRLTGYLMIDIDAGSSWHPRNDWSAYKHLLGVLETIGLCCAVAVQSSASGGLHVYYFLSAFVSTWSLACAAENVLWDAGIALAPGELESFPNAKSWGSYYNPHRLPLQDGSYLLDADLEPCSGDLDVFLDAAEWSAAGQDHAALQAALRRAKRPKCRKLIRQSTTLGDRHAGCRVDLEAAIAEGWTAHHQTNQLLRLIAKYARMWLGLQGHALVQKMVEIARNCPGYETWCRHQHEIEKRCREWARWAERQHSPYPSQPQRQGSYRASIAAVERPETNNIVTFQPNAERQRQAISRLQHCVALLQEAEALPLSVSERSRAIIAKSKEVYDGMGFSQSTLHKIPYLALWHPVHAALLVDDQPLPDPWDDPLPEGCVNPDPELVYRQFAMKVMGETLLLPPAKDCVCARSCPEGEFHQSTNSLISSTSLENSSDSLSVTSLETFPDSQTLNHLIPSLASTLDRNPSVISFSYSPVVSGAALPAHKHPLSNGDDTLLQPLPGPQLQALDVGNASAPCHPTLDVTASAEIASGADLAPFTPLGDELLEEQRNVMLCRGGVFIYAGPVAHSLVSLQGKSKMQVRGIQQGEPVKVCPDALHSNPRLIHVQPFHGADDWRDGIAVRWDRLIPLANPSAAEERLQGGTG